MARVWADTDTRIDRFAGLRRIGIDEISYQRHHKYWGVTKRLFEVSRAIARW